MNCFDDIKLERVEAYSWGKRDCPIVLFINITNMNSMLSIGYTDKGHDDMFKLGNLENENICRVTGNLVGDIIYWDVFSLRNMFKEKINSDELMKILNKYNKFIHKCY